MAFGKEIETKRIKNAVLEDTLTRARIIEEEKTNKNWKKKWNWLLAEYNDLHKRLEELSKGSLFLSHVNKDLGEKDKRSIRPIPETTNHEYGWIPNLPDFKLEKYGPDWERGPPLPPEYYIQFK